jgi:hypothetical protein
LRVSIERRKTRGNETTTRGTYIHYMFKERTTLQRRGNLKGGHGIQMIIKSRISSSNVGESYAQASAG